MMLDSKFVNKYVNSMVDSIKIIDPNLKEKDIQKIVLEMIKEQGCNPEVTLDNNYTGESRETTLLSVFDWVLEREPIICGNATFYKNQYEAINPIAKMLEGFLTQRKKYKKQMFAIKNTDSPEYLELDIAQNNEKINSNSYYGASGAPSSAFYSVYSGPATTHSAQEVISTAETLFEGFVADNYYFLNITECLEWARAVLKQQKKDYENTIEDFIQIKSVKEVKERLLWHILDVEDIDFEILENYISNLSEEQRTYLYYKNNLLKFIEDHNEIQELILTIFSQVENLEYADLEDPSWFGKVVPDKYKEDFIDKSAEKWNKFVNIQYFMDPNDVPNSIKGSLNLLKDYLIKYVYCRYLSLDRIYRLKNFKRKVVTVIDTDSNILSLDTSIDYIMDNIVKDQDFNREWMKNIFICVNTLAYVLTNAVTDILLTFGEYSNIPEEFRPIYNMKNEFYFSKLIIGLTKKRYISKILLREGNLMNPPKYDIKGFDFKKATTSEFAEEFYMGLLKKYVINSESIELRSILKELKEFKQNLRDSIGSGDRKFLPNISAKELAAYKDPYSQASVKAVGAWNALYPENRIDVPAKVSLLKLNIFKEEDILPLKETNEDIYNTIIDKIFNDETGLFVRKNWDPPVETINPRTKVKKWRELIPEKYRAKFKDKTIKDWNDFVESYDYSNGGSEGKWIYKKIGMQVLAIPSNESIPEWCQPYIDYSTIINNIIAPFIPVLEIFQSQTVDEGKTINGINRKTGSFSNIVKF